MFSFKPISEYIDINRSSNPNTKHVYSHMFSFEYSFESKVYVESWAHWLQTHWISSVVISVLYILLVFGGKAYMQSRPKYDLRLPLIMWNLCLAVFSIAGTIRMWPDFIYSLKSHGFVYTVCNKECAYGITGFWTLLFCLSKLPELVDTLFIVLRKQELIFLHWYHHATVLIYCWYSYKDLQSTGRWFMTMNYLVHSIMYTYYAFRAMRFKIPRFVSKLITSCQIIQMVVGLYVNYTAYMVKSTMPLISCQTNYSTIIIGTVMYLSYFILFANFFAKAYLSKSRKSSFDATSKSSSLDLNNNSNDVANKNK